MGAIENGKGWVQIGQDMRQALEGESHLHDPSYSVKIYSSGDINVAKQVIREYVIEHPACVTINPTDYIYTGGEEAGFVVGLIYYPRFPEKDCDVVWEQVWEQAQELACCLLEKLYQRGILVQDDTETLWITKG